MVNCDIIIGRRFSKDLLNVCFKLKCLKAFRENFKNKIYKKNANLYANLSVFDTSAVEFLKVSLVANFAEYYPNFFDKSDSKALKHKEETARRSCCLL